MRISLVLVLALALIAPSAAAQPSTPAPPSRLYLHASVGGGALSNTLDFGVREVRQNAYGWSGLLETGLQRGRRSIGLRFEAVRARRGDAGDLRAVLPTNNWYDAAQVNALVVTRQRLLTAPLGLGLYADAGAGAGYNVTYVQASPSQIALSEGAPLAALELSRRARVLPLLHSGLALSREVGRTSVGIGVSGAWSVGGGEPAFRYGIEVRRRL